MKRSGAEVTRVRKMLRNDMACYKARARQYAMQRYTGLVCHIGMP